MNRDRLPADIALAANRIKAHVRETPLEFSPSFSEMTGARVWMKLENLQLTGSFKVRGAFNKLLTMTEEERQRGGVAASSGNHGAAIAYAMSKLGIGGIIFVPEKTSAAKVDSIRRSGGDVRFFGTDGLDTETHAREYAAEHGMSYLSPYNDAAVIAGQGSCGVEIARQLPDVDAIYIAVGGGGLLSGVGTILKTINKNLRIVSCQPAASAVMTESVRAGKVVDMPGLPTLSDGTAGGIESDAVTFDICRDITTDYIVVSEEEIAEAMRAFIDSHHMLIEGAAGVALAGLIADSRNVAGKNVVVLVCGGNISRDTLRQVI
ncbi:MAG: threonine/serine dehydratase [Gammaproteobacteria bacterium]|nr:threonine/serine dehydratase [Gammaproteobacteria bacterium]MDH4315294.1 threonine/serine dehydratase [Gammaproteobacteria bacterium]MDH5213940.1 threonine/serine dehydratase [Gammaproteobacteria bacterium]